MTTREKRHLRVVEPQVETTPEQDLAAVSQELHEVKERMDADKKTYDGLREQFFELLTVVTGKRGKARWTGPDGYVYGRDVSMRGAGKVDLDALLEDEPEIAEAIIDMVPVVNEDKVEEYLLEHPKKTRTLQQYVSDGTPEYKLARITEAKGE